MARAVQANHDVFSLLFFTGFVIGCFFFRRRHRRRRRWEVLPGIVELVCPLKSAVTYFMNPNPVPLE